MLFLGFLMILAPILFVDWVSAMTIGVHGWWLVIGMLVLVFVLAMIL